MAVKFLVGTVERYAQLKEAGSLNAESFYRISGTNDMYIGERKLTSEEDVQKIIMAMQMGMEMIKKENKEKYTPKKYRK